MDILPYVGEQLETKFYYHIAYILRQGNKLIYMRTMFNLDERKVIILCAMPDLTDFHALENGKTKSGAFALCGYQIRRMRK